jgi:uroporphyrinogen-III synthase
VIAAALIFLSELEVRLLLTRPEADAARTAAALRRVGHAVLIVPLLQIETLAGADFGEGPWAGILVTSANAARAVAQHKGLPNLLGLPVIAAGNSSAEAMRSAGFRDVVSARGGEKEVAAAAAQRFKAGDSLLYLAGADRFGDVAADLKTHAIAVNTVVVYRAVPVASLPASGAEALARGIDGVLHFSRRSAAAYVDVMLAARLREEGLEKLAHFCLSRQVAEPLAVAGAGHIMVAPQPTEAALIALIPGG